MWNSTCFVFVLFRGFSIHYLAYLADIFNTGRWSSYPFWDVRKGESQIRGIIRSTPLQTSVKFIPQCCLEGITLPCGDYLFWYMFVVSCVFEALRSKLNGLSYVQPFSEATEFNEGSWWYYQWRLSWKFNGGVQRWRCFYGRFFVDCWAWGDNSILTKYLDLLICLPHQKLARIKVRCSVKVATKCMFLRYLVFF